MRRPTPDEADAVAAAIDAWGDGLTAAIRPADAVILVHDRDEGLGLHLVSTQVADEIPNLPWPSHAAGLPLGRLVDDAWRPSMEAAQRVPRNATDRYALLDDAVVGRFLYGRGVAADTIRRFGNAATAGRTVFVYAPNGDALGLGRVVPDRHGRRRLDPIIDLGWYLREGG